MSSTSAQVTRFLDAWFAMRQLIQAANFNRFHQAGLSATQFMTLNLLPEHRRGMSIGELSRRMNLKPSTVAKTIDSLEVRGLVSRRRDTEDRRIVMVALTKAGGVLQNSAAGQLRDQMIELFRAIPPASRSSLVEGLESLIEAGRALTSSTSGEDPTHERRDAVPAKRNAPRSPRQ